MIRRNVGEVTPALMVAASVACASAGWGKTRKRIKGKKIKSFCFINLFYEDKRWLSSRD